MNSKWSSEEKARLNDLANKYTTYDDYDYWINRAACKIIVPRVEGLKVLQMGCASGVLTECLVEVVDQLDIVEGSSLYASQVRQKFGEKVSVMEELFEEFCPKTTYQAIILDNTLHLLRDPDVILEKIRQWLSKDGRFYLTVPNALSLHRRLGIKMNMLKNNEDITERGDVFGQFNHFTYNSTEKILCDHGYVIDESFGYLLKPFSNKQMIALGISGELFEALFEIGRDFPDIANQLYFRARST